MQEDKKDATFRDFVILLLTIIFFTTFLCTAVKFALPWIEEVSKINERNAKDYFDERPRWIPVPTPRPKYMVGQNLSVWDESKNIKPNAPVKNIAAVTPTIPATPTSTPKKPSKKNVKK